MFLTLEFKFTIICKFAKYLISYSFAITFIHSLYYRTIDRSFAEKRGNVALGTTSLYELCQVHYVGY